MESTALSKIRDYVSSLPGEKTDYCDLYVQSATSRGILFEDGRMDTLSSSTNDGVGARLIRGEDTVYAHVPGATSAAAAWALSEACGMSGTDIRRLPEGEDESLFPGTVPPPLPRLDADFFHDLDGKMRAESPLLRQATFRYRSSVKSVLVIRGDGGLAAEERTYTTFAVHVVVERDGLLQTGYEARSLSSGVERFWEDSSAEEIAMAALRRGLLMLDSIPCPAGVMPVLLDGTAGGTMIHEACGHGLEADIIRKDYSVYRDRVGELVANPLVTIVDDATLEGCYGSYLFDDEGTPARRTVLVEDGVLKGYMTDILSARMAGLPLTGNGRRESYRHQPLPRMSNTFITAGNGKRDEMIAGMKRGLLVSRMGGGEVNPTSGDFVFYVTEGYLVEEGRVGAPVRGATLTGNGPESLRNISAVGETLVLEPGTCGKSGQGVPVTDGQPTLLIDNLIVGGCDTGDGCQA